MFVCRALLVVLLAASSHIGVESSQGDNNDFFRECRFRCNRVNCTEDGLGFTSTSQLAQQQGVFDQLLLWTCTDECKYECMWKTVDAFIDRGWGVPQFHGKWPFVRILGLQEPASVLFSVMNFIAHFQLLRHFGKSVRPDSPCFLLWHIFGYVCLNGWIWSTVFHARDVDLTEFLDYVFAYSIVLVTLYCMVMRFLHNKSLILRGVITAIFLSYYLNYFMYLYVGKFNYSFNMKANIVTGALSALGWIIWSLKVRKNRPYSKKMIYFYVLFGAAFSLEVLDFPPFLWIFDAHALWHLSSVPLVFFVYSFAVEDCKQLRREKWHADNAHKL